jgi:hypothetical protein
MNSRSSFHEAEALHRRDGRFAHTHGANQMDSTPRDLELGAQALDDAVSGQQPAVPPPAMTTRVLPEFTGASQRFKL